MTDFIKVLEEAFLENGLKHENDMTNVIKVFEPVFQDSAKKHFLKWLVTPEWHDRF